MRPLPVRPVPTYVGKEDSVAGSSRPTHFRPLPPWVVPTYVGKSDSSALKPYCDLSGAWYPQRQNLIHLPGEPAGVLPNWIAAVLATESRSPAPQGGRGRRRAAARARPSRALILPNGAAAQPAPHHHSRPPRRRQSASVGFSRLPFCHQL